MPKRDFLIGFIAGLCTFGTLCAVLLIAFVAFL